MFLGEVVDIAFYESAVIVFAGLLLFHQEELKQGFRSKTVTKEEVQLETFKEEQTTGVV